MLEIDMEIKAAAQRFEALLAAQMMRVKSMADNAAPLDVASLDCVRIGLCPGDGIGPTIMTHAQRILEFLLKDELSSGAIKLVPIEGLTIENRTETHSPVPGDTLLAVKSCHVLLKGPTTTPKGGEMESANVVLRRELDLFANVRPVRIPALDIDWTFFRENTEGEYSLGSQGISIGDALYCDFKITTDLGTRRIARAAMEYARAHGKKNVAIVTKANIMKKTDGAFSRICHEVGEGYPELNLEDWYIDIMTANLLNPTIRSRFEVFILPNLYGDIITDEAAQLQGGMGTAGSANLGSQYAMFEAIHGSAPRMVEQGLVAYASPESLLRAAVMLLRHIGRDELALRLERALDMAEETCMVTGDASGATGYAFAARVLQLLEGRCA